MQRIGKDVTEQADQVFGELLVEEQTHRSSCRKPDRSALALGGVRQAGSNVIAHQLRKLFKQLIFRGATRQIPQNIAYRNPRATDAGLPKSNRGVDTDSIQQAHDPKCTPSGAGKSELLVGRTPD
jgi:hypothetical protein